MNAHEAPARAGDLQAARELANRVRDRLYGEGHDDPQVLRLEIERLVEFQKTADETIVACVRERNALESRSLELHNQQARADFDRAIAELDGIIDRYNSLCGRLVETIQVARNALNRWETEQARMRRPPGTPS